MMDSIQYGNRRIDFKIKRVHRRRNVGIHVDPGAVTVFSPQDLDDDKIRAIVKKKARWIIEKEERIKRNNQSNSSKEFVSGESFPYLGRCYRLKVIKSLLPGDRECRLVNGRFLVVVNGNSGGKNDGTAVRKALVGWYLAHAETKIKERVSRFAPLIGKGPSSIKIKNQTKRWGSCSRSGIIRFNWKIVMAPISIMDYVIVHELCHLIYPHHSTKFWQKVRTIIPDYAQRRMRLKEISSQIGDFD